MYFVILMRGSGWIAKGGCNKASLCGHYEVVELLLESGAVCERDTFQGERILYNALNNRIKSLLLRYDVLLPFALRALIHPPWLMLRGGGIVFEKRQSGAAVGCAYHFLTVARTVRYYRYCRNRDFHHRPTNGLSPAQVHALSSLAVLPAETRSPFHYPNHHHHHHHHQ